MEPWDFEKCAYDPEKSIEVGCAYLAWLYEYWRTRMDHVVCDLDTAVVASYNAGQGRVRKAKGKLADLPLETQRYVKRFAAAKEKFRLRKMDKED